MARFNILGLRYQDDAGDPLIVGFIKFEVSGGGTDKDTFADVNLTIKNENPVQLTGSGKLPNTFFNGTARATLFTSAMVQIEVQDPVGGGTLEGSFSAWDSLTVYDIPDIVVGSDNNFYLSKSDGNQDNNPVTDDGSNWAQIKFIHVWNAATSFALAQTAQGSDGLLYVSLVADNLNNNPVTDDGINWGPSSAPNVDDITQAVVSDYAFNNFG